MSTSTIVLLLSLILISCASTTRDPASVQGREDRQFQESENLRQQMMGHR